MLKEVKVDSDMVLVATQNWQTLVRAFPNCSQFSRIVTRVNFKDGAVFADPADSAAPFGEVPWFDRGVQGLAVKGSKVQEAVIPAGTADDNVSTGKTTMRIAKDWTTEGDSEIELKGAEAIEFRADLMETAPEKLEQRLTDIFAYGNSDAEVTQIAHPGISGLFPAFRPEGALAGKTDERDRAGRTVAQSLDGRSVSAAAVHNQRASLRRALQQS